MKTSMELLAPAGGMSELIAGVQSGADAIYLGAAAFSARAGAGNFTREELEEAVKYAHGYGVKVHCAINTLIKERELPQAIEIAIMAAECGVDALIIQDVGFAGHIRKVLPQMELHGSTQMTVTSLEGVRYLEKQGFSRVVLARELSLGEIEEIVKGARAEIEVFVHGAICMSYSGQCLMSSILGGRSGNRGRCAQPCRLEYTLLENGNAVDKAYILSPKDMALIGHLDELKRIGVASLKIEGRLKSAEYVSAVCGVYRKYIDNPRPVAERDIGELIDAFSRSGFTDGYFIESLGKNMMSHKNPANNSGSSYTPEARERAGGKIVRKIPITMVAALSMGEPIRLTAYDNEGHTVTVTGDVKAERAIKTSLDEERLRKQLEKLGDTPFVCEETILMLEDGITVPIKEINATRRRLTDLLWQERYKRDKQEIVPCILEDRSIACERVPYLTAEVETYGQGVAVMESGVVKRIYASPSVARRLLELGHDTEVVTRPGDILCDEEIVTESCIAPSFGAIEKYGDKVRYGDFRLNVYNSLTGKAFENLDAITLSPELNLREIYELSGKIDCDLEAIAYGRLPLMVMRNCPIKAMGRCQKGKNTYTLRDRKNMEFNLLCKEGCRVLLINSKPIYIADILDEFIGSGVNAIRLLFTTETEDEVREVLKTYQNALSGERVDKPKDNTFTRGHLKRGVI